MPPDAVSCRKRIHRTLLALITVLMLSSCVGAPVQQMSDARQAIESAVQAGAPQFAPRLLEEAARLVEEAEAALAAREYERAGELASRAREKAIAARKASLAAREGEGSPE